jgi:anti-anti-sigma factor
LHAMKHEIHDDALVLQPAGRIDGGTAGAFETDSLALIEAGMAHIVIDLSLVDYLSSAGLRSLLIIAKRVRSNGGSASLCGLGSNVAEVIAVSGFDSIFGVFPDAESARRPPGV